MNHDIAYEIDLLNEGDEIIIYSNDFVFIGIIKRIGTDQFKCKSYENRNEIIISKSSIRNLRKNGNVIFPQDDL